MILEALQRTMAVMAREWQMRFANSGAEALRMMEIEPADAIVSDMRMPYMNGAQLLHEVMLKHPKTIRLILSGFSDAEVIMKCIGGTHQFISKPCSGETLRNILKRALGMDQWLNSDSLKSLVSKLPILPSMPTLYFEIVREAESENGSLEKVGSIIQRDPAMTAKILQLVNSAFFGLRRQMSDPTEAVMQLGFETIRSLVLGIHVFSEMKSKGRAETEIQKLWNHSMAVAARAKNIARTERMERELVEASFTAGLLHDVGRLVLWANLPEKYEEAVRLATSEKIALIEAEESVFKASHASLGGYMLGLWGLPVPLVEAVVFHHMPSFVKSPSVSPLSVVHLSNVLEQETSAEFSLGITPGLDQAHLTEVGMWERAQAWYKSVCKASPISANHEKDIVCR
jgi:putative nucleotidyltransferase with HDIG domain